MEKILDSIIRGLKFATGPMIRITRKLLRILRYFSCSVFEYLQSENGKKILHQIAIIVSIVSNIIRFFFK